MLKGQVLVELTEPDASILTNEVLAGRRPMASGRLFGDGRGGLGRKEVSPGALQSNGY